MFSENILKPAFLVEHYQLKFNFTGLYVQNYQTHWVNVANDSEWTAEISSWYIEVSGLQ